eukprot:GSChrysophyteH1.ASY1.ANO1.27.1 assembled CDS
MVSSAQDTGIGISAGKIFLQQTWPTAAPTPSPAPTASIPTGNLIVSTAIQYIYTNAADCSDNSKVSSATGTSYGLCWWSTIGNGTYIRNVTGVPAVTNPNDPYTVPVYSAQFSDSQCTNKIMDYPDTSIRANSCDSAGEAGLYMFVDYIPNDTSKPPLNIAPPSKMQNANIAYTGNTQTSCQTQDLTQVRSYDAVRSGCNSFSSGSSMQLTKCMASSNLVNATVSTYTTTDCTGVADNTPHVYVPCSSPGFTTRWGTCADSGPTPESSCALQNKNFFEYLTQTTRLALCKLQAKTV